MSEHWSDIVIRRCEAKGRRPCGEAIEWMQAYPDARNAFANCHRGDWLLWLAVMLDVKREKVVLAACKCARQALVYVPDGETRPLKAIDTGERWARGEATLDDVRVVYAAADAAYIAANAAANAAAYAAANAAAYAAANAAYAANAANIAANAANIAAEAAAYAATAAAHAAANATCAAAGDSREDSFRLSADIVRALIGQDMVDAWERMNHEDLMVTTT